MIMKSLVLKARSPCEIFSCCCRNTISPRSYK